MLTLHSNCFLFFPWFRWTESLNLIGSKKFHIFYAGSLGMHFHQTSCGGPLFLTFNSMSYQLSREKNNNSVLVKNIFFHEKLSLEHIQIYIRLNCEWNDLFRIFFSLVSTKISDYANRPNSRFAKIFSETLTLKRNITCKVNSYHTSAELLSIP